MISIYSMANLLDTRRVFVVIVALGLFAMAARDVTDPDVWWHLRTGQLILQNHAVFHADPYSFTKFGQPWVNHEWLSDITIFTVYKAAGWPGLIALFAAITSGTFMLLFVRCSGPPYLTAAFAVWGAIASAPSWGVRPQTFSIFLASLFLLILERSSVRPNLLWYLLPGTLVWVNLHAGYAIGIALMVLFLIGDLLGVVFGFGEWSQSRKKTKKLAIALAACLAIIPLNPYGTRMYWYPLQTLHSQSMQSYISEWLSPNFHDGMFLPLLLMLLAIFVAAAVSPLRLRPVELLLLAATTWAALHSVRHIAIFALVAAPLLSRLIYARTSQSQRSASRTKAASSVPILRLCNGLILAAFLAFTLIRLRQVVVGQADAEARAFPSAAVSFISKYRISGPLLNHYNWGGYLIWKLYPGYRVYIDGRSDLYGDEFMDQSGATYNISNESWREPLEKWQIRSVILPPNVPLVAALRCEIGWKEVYSDPRAVIFERD
jgi:hypothetical protein